MRKLAHIRLLGYGLRTWDSPRYVIPGVSKSVSYYDEPEVQLDSQTGREIHANVDTLRFRRPPDNPTTTRIPRLSAFFNSAGGAIGWQGNLGNVRWSQGPPFAALMARPDHPALSANWNANQQGSKEQQAATVYDPWPAASALYPKAI